MSGLLVQNRTEDQIVGIVSSLVKSLEHHPGPVICVSDDVSGGIVPADRMSRKFRDHQGDLNRQLASLSDLVVYVRAGLPQILKGAIPAPGDQK